MQAKTTIPISKILDWSDDASNPVGSEYIMIEYAAGVSLHEKWPTMDVGEQIRCIKAICEKVKEVVDLEFLPCSSLYFAETPYIPESKVLLDQEFCVGPHCGAMYWNCNPTQPRYYQDLEPNQGPCKSHHAPSF